MAEYFVLSNFGVRYFMFAYSATGAVPSSSTVGTEIKDVISCSLGGVSKENTKYRTLNGNGWEQIATLGNSQEDAEFQLLRTGSGSDTVYDGDAGSTTFQALRHWMMSATAGAGSEAPKMIIECLPRGAGVYEGTLYNVVPSSFNPSTRDTDTGQEYSMTVSPFGPPVPVSVTYTASTDTFAFSAITASSGTT